MHMFKNHIFLGRWEDLKKHFFSVTFSVPSNIHFIYFISVPPHVLDPGCELPVVSWHAGLLSLFASPSQLTTWGIVPHCFPFLETRRFQDKRQCWFHINCHEMRCSTIYTARYWYSISDKQFYWNWERYPNFVVIFAIKKSTSIFFSRTNSVVQLEHYNPFPL